MRFALSENMASVKDLSFSLSLSTFCKVTTDSSPCFHASRPSISYFRRNSAVPPMDLSGSIKSPLMGSRKSSSIVRPNILNSFGTLDVKLDVEAGDVFMASSQPAEFLPAAEFGTLVLLVLLDPLLIC